MVISPRFIDFRMSSRNFNKIVVVEWDFRNQDIVSLRIFSFSMNSHVWRPMIRSNTFEITGRIDIGL